MVVFRLGFGRKDSSRLEVNIFFEKRTKNGTEVFPRKEICILSFDYNDVVGTVAMTTSPSSLL